MSSAPQRSQRSQQIAWTGSPFTPDALVLGMKETSGGHRNPLMTAGQGANIDYRLIESAAGWGTSKATSRPFLDVVHFVKGYREHPEKSFRNLTAC